MKPPFYVEYEPSNQKDEGFAEITGPYWDVSNAEAYSRTIYEFFPSGKIVICDRSDNIVRKYEITRDSPMPS